MQRAGYNGPRRSVAMRSYPSPKVRDSKQEHLAAIAQEQRPRGASPRSMSGVAAKRIYPTSKERLLCGRRRSERSYSTFKVRRGGHEKIPLVQGKEQWLRFAGAAVKRYPTSKVRETQVRQEVFQESIRGQTH